MIRIKRTTGFESFSVNLIANKNECILFLSTTKAINYYTYCTYIDSIKF